MGRIGQCSIDLVFHVTRIFTQARAPNATGNVRHVDTTVDAARLEACATGVQVMLTKSPRSNAREQGGRAIAW